MARIYYKNINQKDAYSSPWSKKESVLIRIWEVVWTLFIKWLPKKGSILYVTLLRLFGSKIPSHAFVHPTTRIYAPWLLSIGEHACLGARCEIYNLGPVKIGNRTTLAQYSYVCNGTHDLNDPKLPLMVGDVSIGNDVFIGAKALIMPGVAIADGSVIGAGAVLTKDTEKYGIYAGNPAKFIKRREIKGLKG